MPFAHSSPEVLLGFSPSLDSARVEAGWCQGTGTVPGHGPCHRAALAPCCHFLEAGACLPLFVQVWGSCAPSRSVMVELWYFLDAFLCGEMLL